MAELDQRDDKWIVEKIFNKKRRTFRKRERVRKKKERVERRDVDDTE